MMPTALPLGRLTNRDKRMVIAIYTRFLILLSFAAGVDEPIHPRMSIGINFFTAKPPACVPLEAEDAEEKPICIPGSSKAASDHGLSAHVQLHIQFIDR